MFSSHTYFLRSRFLFFLCFLVLSFSFFSETFLLLNQVSLKITCLVLPIQLNLQLI